MIVEPGVKTEFWVEGHLPGIFVSSGSFKDNSVILSFFKEEEFKSNQQPAFPIDSN
jgi:hypothetical protein